MGKYVLMSLLVNIWRASAGLETHGIEALWTYAPMYGKGARGGATIPRPKRFMDSFNRTITALSEHRLGSIAHRRKQDFANAVPFPHIMLEGDEALLPRAFLEGVAAENPEGGRADGRPQTLSDSFCWLLGTCTGGVSKKGTHQEGKAWVSLPDHETHPHTHALLELMKSQAFVGFLEKLTGVAGLVTDAEHHGGGVHRTLNGGSLEVHADGSHSARPPCSLHCIPSLHLLTDGSDCVCCRYTPISTTAAASGGDVSTSFTF